jgi:zinc and cadmium transporter
MMNIYGYSVLSVALVSGISLLGVILLSFREAGFRRLLPLLVALAIGALLGDAFIHLIPESLETIPSEAMASTLVIVGILTFFLLEKFLHWHHHGEDVEEEHVHPVGKLILVSDAAHNFIDGIILAASFSVSVPVGIATTVAVILHEIPQEIGDFAVLLHAGYKKSQALWFNFLSALTAFLGLAFFFIFQNIAEEVMLYVLPIAAGGFIYIALSDLIPELHRSSKEHDTSAARQFIAICVGVCLMLLLLFVE